MGRLETGRKLYRTIEVHTFMFISDNTWYFLNLESWRRKPHYLLLLDLNSFSPLKFTGIISTRSSNFLDINVQLLNGYTSNCIHNKPSNHQQYLHFSSCQYNYTKRWITCNLVVRGSQSIPDIKDLIKYNNPLEKAFVNREYPRNLLNLIPKLHISQQDIKRIKTMATPPIEWQLVTKVYKI